MEYVKFFCKCVVILRQIHPFCVWIIEIKKMAVFCLKQVDSVFTERGFLNIIQCVTADKRFREQ